MIEFFTIMKKFDFQIIDKPSVIAEHNVNMCRIYAQSESAQGVLQVRLKSKKTILKFQLITFRNIEN